MTSLEHPVSDGGRVDHLLACARGLAGGDLLWALAVAIIGGVLVQPVFIYLYLPALLLGLGCRPSPRSGEAIG